MEKKSIYHPVKTIKNILSKQEFVLAILLAKSTIENENTIDLFILIEDDRFSEELVDMITKVETNHPIHPDIWTLEAFQTADSETIHQFFKNGKLIYWNAMVDILASQVLKVKSYTLFTFTFNNFDQKSKVRINYQLYGKKNNGLLSTWDGQRLAKSCFYVPYSNKYKVTRFFNKNDIAYQQKDTYF